MIDPRRVAYGRVRLEVCARQPYDQFSIAPSKETKPRILDRKFLFLAGLATTATVLDVATTSHCLSTYANC